MVIRVKDGASNKLRRLKAFGWSPPRAFSLKLILRRGSWPITRAKRSPLGRRLPCCARAGACAISGETRNHGPINWLCAAGEHRKVSWLRCWLLRIELVNIMRSEDAKFCNVSFAVVQYRTTVISCCLGLRSKPIATIIWAMFDDKWCHHSSPVEL